MAQLNREPASESRPATPRWVKAVALAAAVVMVVVVVLMLLAGGEHGPSRHGGRVDSLGSTSTARAA